MGLDFRVEELGFRRCFKVFKEFKAPRVKLVVREKPVFKVKLEKELKEFKEFKARQVRHQ